MLSLTLRVFTVLAAMASATPGVPQGGFGGGAAGGGRSGAVAEGDEVVKTHILTPGDRGEWPITAKQNETVIVSAQTNVFDAALEIVDKDGKVLAQNDDVREGEQNPLLLYRFASAGEYKILVKGYKSAAGGQYTFRLRRFVAEEAKVGETYSGTMGKTGVKWLFFKAEKGKTVVMWPKGDTVYGPDEMIAPNGEKVGGQDGDLSRLGSRTVLEASFSGEYFLRLRGSSEPASKFELALLPAREFTTTIGSPTVRETLPEGGLDHWSFEGKEGDLVRLEATGAMLSVASELTYRPRETDTVAPQEDEEGAKAEPIMFLGFGDKRRGVTFALLRKSGPYRIAVSQPRSDSAADYAFSLLRIDKALPEGAEAKSTLGIGVSEIWTFEAKAGEVLRFDARAEPFDIYLDLYAPDGSLLQAADDTSATFNASFTRLLPKPGRYALRVSSVGGGGSGAYRLSRSSLPVRSLTLGGTESGSLGPSLLELWRFKAPADQLVVLRVQSADFYPWASLYGPDGRSIGFLRTIGVNDKTFVAHVRKAGEYTLWVWSAVAGGKYSIRWVDLEK